MFNLRKVFQDMLDRQRAEKARQRTIGTVVAAIETGNTHAALSLLDTVSFRDMNDAERVLARAVVNDNVPVLDKILSQTADVDMNHKLPVDFKNQAGRPPLFIEMPLLALAVQSKAQNAAMRLAGDPAVDVTQAGLTRFFTRHAMQTAPHKSPLALARQNGMDDVVVVLAARALERKAAQAMQRNAP